MKLRQASTHCGGYWLSFGMAQSKTLTSVNLSQEIKDFCEQLPTGVLVLNSKNQVIFANSNTYAFVSCAPADLIGTKISDHLADDDRPIFEIWQTAQKDQQPNVTSFVGRCPLRTGGEGLIKFSKHSLQKVSGDFLQVILVEPHMDVDWKPVTKLKENPLWALLTDALDASPQGFNIWQGIRDENGEISHFKLLFMNKVGAAPHNMSSEDMVGQDLDEVFPENRQEGFFGALVDCMQSHKVSEMVLESSKNASWPGTFSNIIVPLSDDRVANSFREVTSEVQELRSLRDRATLDAITGLLNRVTFDGLLNSELNDQEIFAHPLAVCYIDIDNFKVVNDTFGHDAGDFVLKTFADKLQNSLRVGDVVGRMGGDEFAVLLTGLRNREELDKICERISGRVNTNMIWNGHLIEVSASIGVAYHEGEKSLSTSNILREADQAMYLAKKAGKNQYKIIRVD